jgi:hypothetical protein
MISMTVLCDMTALLKMQAPLMLKTFITIIIEADDEQLSVNLNLHVNLNNVGKYESHFIMHICLNFYSKKNDYL